MWHNSNTTPWAVGASIRQVSKSILSSRHNITNLFDIHFDIFWYIFYLYLRHTSYKTTYFGGSGGFSPCVNLLAVMISCDARVKERRFSSRARWAISFICCSASLAFFSVIINITFYIRKMSYVDGLVILNNCLFSQLSPLVVDNAHILIIFSKKSQRASIWQTWNISIFNFITSKLVNMGTSSMKREPVAWNLITLLFPVFLHFSTCLLCHFV